MAKPQTYPRPDFERPNLKWASLNGPWDFLFDDEDVGLTESWQLTGLPAQTKLSPSSQKANSRSASGSVVERIASGTQELLRNNILAEDNAATVIHKRQIQVPFVFQSTASGINDRGVHEVLWYERTVPDLRTPEDKPKGARVLLRFGAVDYEAAVWVNGQYVGGHRGGHVPFQLDVTDAMNVNPGAASAHRVTVRVSDSAYDLTQPRGKQYWGARPESIFYTPSGGIWQNVWVELAPPVRLADSSHGTVLRSDDIQTGKLRGEVSVQGRRAGQHLAVEVEARLEGISVAKSRREELPKDRDLANFEVDVRLSQEQLAELPASVLEGAPASDGRCWREGVALWSPEHPQLYEVTMTLLDSGSGKTLDQVQTQIGMRSLDWSRADGTWRLNGRPYFQALCLDQGYWPDTFMTPPSMDSLKHDIMLAKRMGLNGCRKHQKVEDPAFYYWADKLGYLVWAEMASAYQFSAEYVDRFDQEWTEAVKLAINHPSVVTWTLANESWGYTDLANNVEQRNHIRSLYYKTKTMDPTRCINDNCGWEHVVTDLTTFHDYADGPDLSATCADLSKILDKKAGRDLFVSAIQGRDAGASHQTGAPVMCTEFGGVNISLAKKGDDDRDWGYTTAADPEDLLRRVERLVKAVVQGGHCCAFVYTQLTDIEQEANGLYSFDRKEKLDSVRVKAVMDEAAALYYGTLKSDQ